ncbi:MAG TPA: hypothetical protein VF171_02790 [Trueperaceae bacterium]
MPAVLAPPTHPLQLPTHLRRYCGDWLAQFLWAIENHLEDPADLYAPPGVAAPRPMGTLDLATGLIDPDLRLHHARVATPHLPAYVCYLPPESRLGFPGRRVTLYTHDQPKLRQALAARGLLWAWQTYSQGGSYQIYSYHRPSGGMQLTPKARRTPGLGAAAETLADAFTPQLRPGPHAGAAGVPAAPA